MRTDAQGATKNLYPASTAPIEITLLFRETRFWMRPNVQYANTVSADREHVFKFCFSKFKHALSQYIIKSGCYE